MINGKIIINAFKRPIESVRQAERLKEEFSKLGVGIDIISDENLRSGIVDGAFFSGIKQADFIIYLDKDKYSSAVLDGLNVKLFNPHKSIRLCDDKGETYIALKKAGIAVPDTIFGALSYSNKDIVNKDRLKEIVNILGYPIIIKESFGSMGKGVYKAENFEELLSCAEKVKDKPHLFQKYLGYKFGTDIRVIVIGGKAVSAIERKNAEDFRSNVAQGGSAKAFDLPKDFIDIAEKTAKALNLCYCGIDILFGDNGEPVICEVNSNAFFEGMEKAIGKNIAKIYAEYILNSI